MLTGWVHHKHLCYDRPRAGRGRHRSTPGSTSAELEPRLTDKSLTRGHLWALNVPGTENLKHSNEVH